MNLRTTAALLLSTLAAACGGSEPSAEAEPAAALPERYHLAEAPGDALEVAALREGAQAGEVVVVRGKVRELGESFATLVLTDLSFESCDVRPGDSCSTPWDYCCEDPTALAAGSAQVEFHEAGEPLASAAEGFHGLELLSLVTVRGHFEPDEAGNLLVVADGIHVAP